jgi:L-fucose isomerase-like protein
MALTVKPVIILSRGFAVMANEEGGLDIRTGAEDNKGAVPELVDTLKKELGDKVTLLDELVVSKPVDLDPIFLAVSDIDVILACFLGVAPIDKLLRWPGPIIGFSGQHTPAFALYAIGEERHIRKDLFIALDFEDIHRLFRCLEVRKRLARTRSVLFGMPPSWYLRWYSFPDLEALRRKTGIEFIPVEMRELVEKVSEANPETARGLADEWRQSAKDTVGPSMEDIVKAAAVYAAMDEILTSHGASAMAINCLEITQSRKFRGQITNPCMAMSHLRDLGVPTACEMDIPAMMTMLLLGSLGNKPTFLGNIVRADPHDNAIKLSHCILPTRMHGFDQEPLPYILRDFHGSDGLTAFTEVPRGVQVTIARAQRNLERVVAIQGEIVGCRDTISCRNTLTIRIKDVRAFIEQAEGNHHVLIFGDYLKDLQVLGHLLGYAFIAP